MLALALHLAACGGGGGSGGASTSSAAGRYERLALRHIDPAHAQVPDTKVVARFHFAQASAPRLVSKEQLAAAPTQDHEWNVPEECTVRKIGSEMALIIPYEGMQTLRLDTVIDTSKVSRLLIRGVFSKGSIVETSLLRNGEVAGKPSNVSPQPARDVQTVEIDLLRFRRASLPFDGVVFRMGSKRPPARLMTLDLLDRPLVSWLPTLASGPELIPLDNDAMRGVGLLDGQPMVTTVRVDKAGERLRFAVAEPKEMRSGKPTKRVIVDTIGENSAGEELFSASLAPTPGKAPTWIHADIDLDPWIGKELEVRFRVETDEKSKRRNIVGKDLIALSEPQVSRPGDEARLVLLVTSDTHRADHLGNLMGADKLETPAIDDLAARGVQFLDAWSTTNITQPSHTSLLTGLSPRDTRIVTNSGHLVPDAFTLAEAFQQAGWATYGAVSVRHLGARGASLGQGFDRMVDPPGQPWRASDPVNQLKSWIEESSGRPVFAWLHIFDAHDPYEPPGEFDGAYYPDDRDPKDPSLPGFEDGRLPFHWTKYKDPEYPLAQYRAEISYLDSELAKLFALPRVQGGHVAFTSDHGEILNALGTWFNHGLSVPDTLHVPLILAGPDVPTARVEGPVEHVNLGRTLLDLAGLARVEFPGRNLLEFIEDSGNDQTERFAMGSNGQHASVTRGPHHLVLSLRKHQGFLRTGREEHQVELYDHIADPRLDNDLVEAKPELAAELRSSLVEWLGEALPGGLAIMGAATPEQMAELAALGYSQAEEVAQDAAWIEPDCSCVHCTHWRSVR